MPEAEEEPQGMRRDEAVVDDRRSALERIATSRTNVVPPRASQGDAKQQKVFNPTQSVGLKSAKCPVCNNDVFEGQVNCNVCVVSFCL